MPDEKKELEGQRSSSKLLCAANEALSRRNPERGRPREKSCSCSHATPLTLLPPSTHATPRPSQAIILDEKNLFEGQPLCLAPKPSTLNPQPSTLNPQPSTSTLNPQPSTLNPQPSTLNPKPGRAPDLASRVA